MPLAPLIRVGIQVDASSRRTANDICALVHQKLVAGTEIDDVTLGQIGIGVRDQGAVRLANASR